MKIEDLKDKQGNVNLDVRIIWDESKPKDTFGDGILRKSVIVKDVDSEKGDENPSAYLDLKGDEIKKFKHLDEIRVTDAYAKLIQNKSGKKQYRLTNAKKIELIE